MINLSFIKLKGKVIDNYEKSKTGWKNKEDYFKVDLYIIGKTKEST